MAITIKGFDQITAGISGFAIASALFATLWYSGKYLAQKEIEQEDKLVLKAEKELRSLSQQDATHTIDTSRHRQNQPAPASGLETHEIWGYQGNLAPWYWGNLHPDFKNCESKTHQSPIDISGSKLDESLKSLKLHYTHGVTSLTFHHQTIQGKIENGSWMEWDGERFDLREVKFHTPSEHRTNGLPWEMEAQLIHQSVSGAKIILSILLTPGRDHSFLNSMTRQLPRIKDEVKDVERLNWQELTPTKRTYWTYIGSETTPPCSPNVRWVVMTEPVQASKLTIDKFVMMQKNNSRPVFTLGHRPLGRSNR